ncbi:MAG: Gfo/Idh/MocA family protein [Bdellovibrionota bacterium]
MSKKAARTSPKKEPLRFAVVGLGHIAQTAVLPAFSHAKKFAQISALVSGDAEKLDKIGRKYKVKNLFSYENFDLCLRSEEVDAVYIALPNSLHLDYAIQALRSGVPVLCEKPLAMSESDCQRLIHAAEVSGAKLMTAYRLHFDQANIKAAKLAKEKIGDLRYFNSSFSYQMKDGDNIRLRTEEGGNPLWDIGVYCINAARTLFRDEPSEVSAMSVQGKGSRFRETEEMVSATVRFPGDRLASFICSFGAADRASYELVGTKGSVRLEAAYEYKMARELRLKVGDKNQTLKFKKSDQFAAELIYFSDCVHFNREPEPSGYEGLADVRVILALQESMRTGRVVSIPRSIVTGKSKRAGMGQWIQRPPVRREPEIVNIN